MTTPKRQWKRSIDNVQPIHDNQGNTTGYLATVTVTNHCTGQVYNDVAYSKIDAIDRHQNSDTENIRDQCIAAAVREASQRCIRNANPTFQEIYS